MLQCNQLVRKIDVSLVVDISIIRTLHTECMFSTKLFTSTQQNLIKYSSEIYVDGVQTYNMLSHSITLLKSLSLFT